jgi:hypothetical protein
VHRTKGDSSHYILLLCNFRRKSLRWHGKDLQSLLCWLEKALWVRVSEIHFIYSHSIINWAYYTVRVPVYLASLSVVRPSVRLFVTQYQLLNSLLDFHVIRFTVSAGEDIKRAWFARIEPQWQSQFNCTLYISWPMLMKYSKEYHTFPSRVAKSREIRCWGRHTLRKD